MPEHSSLAFDKVGPHDNVAIDKVSWRDDRGDIKERRRFRGELVARLFFDHYSPPLSE
jgi:hypothetical protein